MLRLAIVFFVIALLAALMGFGNIEAGGVGGRPALLLHLPWSWPCCQLLFGIFRGAPAMPRHQY